MVTLKKNYRVAFNIYDLPKDQKQKIRQCIIDNVSELGVGLSNISIVEV